MNRLSTAFAQNRTEELSHDVWNDFVTPRFLSSLDLLDATKPRIVIGGRGCGKTMVLRYFSFESQFSKKRPQIPASAFRNVGLYWRIDTQFASVMNARGVEETSWIIAFEHFLVVFVSIEILRSLRSLSESNCPANCRRQIGELNFDSLKSYDTGGTSSTEELRATLQQMLKRFELWVSNVKKVPEPIFLPKSFLVDLIEAIKENCPDLADTSFHVFVDEFENLLPYQQRVINTHIKHSQPPLIFSVAMKRRGFTTQLTLGTESITEINDYRLIDLEENIIASDFELFAAEVLLLHLWKADYKELPVSADQLRDISRLPERSEAAYKKRVLAFTADIFPGLSEHELAVRVFSDLKLKELLKKKIESCLIDRFGSLDYADQLFDETMPKETIVISALVHRSSLSPKAIVAELAKRRQSKKSKFDDWVENNFIGSLLHLYEPYQKVCPFYAGFVTFTKLARGNLRHLLELCYKSIGAISDSDSERLPAIPIETQARAARQASMAFLQEVRSFGTYGNRLHAFVLRIGSLFALSHGRSGQNEPEVNHFSIVGKSQISEDQTRFLNEAIKWTVLFESQETKFKHPRDGKQASFEYVLNPIYSPYFNISYRKRRKLELKVEEFSRLVEGDYQAVSTLLKQFSKRWNVDLEESSPTLFSHLLE